MYVLRRRNGFAPRQLAGDNIEAAITSSMPIIAAELGLGNAAGYRLLSVTAANGPIGGHDQGIIVTIVASGLPLAHKPTDEYPAQTYRAYLEGPALTQDISIPITR